MQRTRKEKRYRKTKADCIVLHTKLSERVKRASDTRTRIVRTKGMTKNLR